MKNAKQSWLTSLADKELELIKRYGHENFVTSAARHRFKEAWHIVKAIEKAFNQPPYTKEASN